eukprot:8441696-Pyramimonas_sp.AAC.1
MTRCEVLQAAARILDRRRLAAGGHHHRPASNLKPSSSRRALWECPPCARIPLSSSCRRALQ